MSLSACQAGLEGQTEDYLQRLQNTLQADQALPERPPPTFPAMPRQRLLQAEITPAIDISLLQFLGLKKCTLSQVVAQRNSALGKVAAASQEALFDLAFVRYAPPCIAYLEANDKRPLADKIRLALDHKQTNLTARLWQAIMAGDEYRRFWSRNNTSEFTSYPEQRPAGQPEAFRDLLAFVQQATHNHPYQEPIRQAPTARAEAIEQQHTELDPGTSATSRSRDLAHERSERPPDATFNIALERYLEIIRQGDGGLLLVQYQTIEHSLSRATQRLQQAMDTPFCYQNKPKPQALIVRNVVNTFFIATIQRHIALLERRYNALLPPLRELENALASGETAAFRQWRAHRDAAFEQARLAFSEHILAIQQLYEQCGLKSGNRAS